MKHIYADHNIFITTINLKNPVFSIFVNNIKIMVPKKSKIIEKVKAKLTVVFFILEMRLIGFYLGLKIDQNRDKQTIKLF